MKSNDSKKRKSNFNASRPCYLSADGKYYCYRVWDEDVKQEIEVRYEVGKDGFTVEWTLFLDETDHEQDLGDRYEEENKDPLFEAKRRRYESDPDGEDAVNPWDTISKGGDPAEILCAEEEPENPDIANVREVIDTKCNERQQNLFFSHFGEMEQLEQIRQREVAESGKDKKLQAILNVKNDVIGKVADAFGVVPVKRRKTKKG